MTIYLLLLGILCLILYQQYRRHFSKLRLAAVRSRSLSLIANEKVIVALELDGMFIDVKSSKVEGYQKVKREEKGIRLLLTKIKDFFGFGTYFKPIESVRTIKSKLRVLSSNPKVQLYLYTRL